MSAITFETSAGTATLRPATSEDIDAQVALNRLCFPSPDEQTIVWNRAQLANHQRLFPEGQMVVELGGKVVAGAASLIVDLGADRYRPHTYAGITDGGYFHTHNPEGDSLYGADLYVDPAARRLGIASQIAEARRQLCRKHNLRRIIAGGRIPGYANHSKLTPEQYIAEVEAGALQDEVLCFQLKQGFVVRGLLRSYVRDPGSKNFATFIEWQNPDYVPTESAGGRKVRVAAVQYQVRKLQSFEDFAEQVEYFVQTASEYRADFVVFPEFLSMQLLSLPELRKLPALEGIARLADMENQFFELMSGLATSFGLHIIAGTHPVRRDGSLYNACALMFPDGHHVLQPKLHITPSEKSFWGIRGGSELRVIPTPKARVGILICYDSEFPEAARYLADQGIEILFVPYCTDDRQGYARVRYCSQARAIENQIFVVTAGIIGNLPSVPAMDIHYGQAAVFTPSDYEFSRDGIAAIADSNVETLLVADLDIHDLYRCRAAGAVRPHLDRRPDLFQFAATLKNDASPLNPEEELLMQTVSDEDE